MAAQTPPYAQQNGSHTAALFRQAFTSLFGATQPGTLASTAGGVVNTTDLAVTAQVSPNMTVNVAGGSSWIPQTQAANGGLYFGLNDATVVVAIAASSATNPRVDLICATVNDAAYSGSTNNWTIQAITGTPTAGANLTNKNGAGALPVASIPLAYVLVPASSTSVTTGNIQDARTFMGMPNASRSNPVGITTAANAQNIGTSSTLVTWTGATVKGGVTFTSNAFVVPVAGLYQVNGAVSSSSSGTAGNTAVAIYQNGTFQVNGQVPGSTSGFYGGNCSGIIQCAAGDALAMYVSFPAASSGVFTGQQTKFSIALVSQ